MRCALVSRLEQDCASLTQGMMIILIADCCVMCSNMHDLLRWYNLVLTQPEVIGLSKQSVVNLTQPLQTVPGTNASFAQGLVVSKSATQETQVVLSAGPLYIPAVLL